jgi:hypothetical protein
MNLLLQGKMKNLLLKTVFRAASSRLSRKVSLLLLLLLAP